MKESGSESGSESESYPHFVTAAQRRRQAELNECLGTA